MLKMVPGKGIKKLKNHIATLQYNKSFESTALPPG